jgi:hypothetical protein
MIGMFLGAAAVAMPGLIILAFIAIVACSSSFEDFPMADSSKNPVEHEKNEPVMLKFSHSKSDIPVDRKRATGVIEQLVMS